MLGAVNIGVTYKAHEEAITLRGGDGLAVLCDLHLVSFNWVHVTQNPQRVRKSIALTDVVGQRLVRGRRTFGSETLDFFPVFSVLWL